MEELGLRIIIREEIKKQLREDFELSNWDKIQAERKKRTELQKLSQKKKRVSVTREQLTKIIREVLQDGDQDETPCPKCGSVDCDCPEEENSPGGYGEDRAGYPGTWDK